MEILFQLGTILCAFSNVLIWFRFGKDESEKIKEFCNSLHEWMQIDILLFFGPFCVRFPLQYFLTRHIPLMYFAPQRKVLFFFFFFFLIHDKVSNIVIQRNFLYVILFTLLEITWKKSEIVMSYSFWDVALCSYFHYLEKEVFLIFIIFAAFGQGIQTGKKMPVITYYLIVVPGICV